MAKRKMIKTKATKKAKTTTKTSRSLTIPVLNLKGVKTGSLAVPKELKEIKGNQILLAQAMRVYLANQRQGTASTKTRGQVSGGGRKPWKQKGTGRARQGSIRAPHWRGGGVVFGPQPRDFSLALPKKMRRLALLLSLAQKFGKGEAAVVDKLEKISGKTKELGKVIAKTDKTLIVDDISHKNLVLATQNLVGVTLKTVAILNIYDILSHKHLLFTKSALEALPNLYNKGKETKV